MTLFSQAKHKFQVISEGEAIPTEPFLLACSEVVPFFGKQIKVLTNVMPLLLTKYVVFFF